MLIGGRARAAPHGGRRGRGAVVGLVAITPGAGYVSYGPALFIGVAAAISAFAVDLKTARPSTTPSTCFRVTAWAASWHGPHRRVCQGRRPGHHRLGGAALEALGALVFISAFTFSGSYLLYKLTNLLIPIRVNAENEAYGLDTSQHGETVLVG
ncbi:MAG: hypothetical protein WKG07_34250 [Hymenobacter sp.]